MDAGITDINENIAGVVLAGGLARRMGGTDKALMKLAGKTLAEHAIEALRPQVAKLAFNTAGGGGVENIPCIKDSIGGFAGPLAGVLAGLRWARAQGFHLLASVAVDTPFFPANLVSSLALSLRDENAQIACAASMGRIHPVFGLWPVEIADDLQEALVRESLRKVVLFTNRYPLAVVEFSGKGHDPFFNINHPEDMKEAEEIFAKR